MRGAGKKSPNFSKYIIYGSPLSFAQSFLSLHQSSNPAKCCALVLVGAFLFHFTFPLASRSDIVSGPALTPPQTSDPVLPAVSS